MSFTSLMIVLPRQTRRARGREWARLITGVVRQSRARGQRLGIASAAAADTFLASPGQRWEERGESTFLSTIMYSP